MNETLTRPANENVIRIVDKDFNRTYGVVFKFDNTTKVHFEVTVKSLSQQEDNLHYFEINRQQVYINDTAPDLLIDKLADDLGKIIYPLNVIVDRTGFIVGISNLRDIQQRWNDNKENIKQYYKGDVTSIAIQKMDQSISTETSLLMALENDWFLSVYFSGLYGLKPFDFRIWNVMRLPVFPYKSRTAFKIKREITEQHTENKSLTIVCSGELEATEAKDNANNLYLKYDLYHKDFSISAITGFVFLQTDKPEDRRIDIEIFHLRERNSSLQK